MKKIISIILSVIMIFALCACGSSSSNQETVSESIKVGLICLHDENSGYDKNFIDAFKSACEANGVEYLIKTNVAESDDAYNAAAELADEGCSIVFADSYGHQQYILQAATEFADVDFVSCTGDLALANEIPNFHNAFANIYEGRYLAGIAAGMKLNEMIADGEFSADEAKLGYVSAMSYAECISGYTSYFLGARSVCPTATMEVIYTGTWYDETLEKESAIALIENGCKIISQHADSAGSPTACEAAGVPNVSYNGSTISYAPNTYIISSRINWEPYFDYAISSVIVGEEFDIDWCGDITTHSVELTEINDAVAAIGTEEAINNALELITNDELFVFDCDNWTVNGAHLISYDEASYFEGNECIWDGYFHESELRSAPYFDIIIDGITILK